MSADRLSIDCSGYEVLVEVPESPTNNDISCKAFNAGLDRSEIDFYETVAGTEEPPSEVESFLQTLGPTFDIGGRKKRYMEAQLVSGDTVTVYGRVEATSGDTAGASNLKLTDGGGKFLISSEQKAELLQKYLYGGLFGLLFGLPPLGFTVLTAI